MVDQVIKIQLKRPHIHQQKIVASKSKRKVLLCGRQFGKSWVCRYLAAMRMLNGEFVIYITPTHELGKTFMEEMILMFPPNAILSDNKTDREIRLINGGRIKFYSGENLDRVRGNTGVNLLIVDEACFIPGLEEHWGSSVLPVLVKNDGDYIIISTPNGHDFVHGLFMRGINGEDGFESWHFRTYDNPFLKPEAIEHLKSSMTSGQISQELEANPSENKGSAFGAAEVINKNIIHQLSTKPVVSYGVDLAGLGGDWTVAIGLDEDGSMAYYDRFQLPWPQTKLRIAKLPKEINKTIDATGMGGQMAIQDLYTVTENIIPFTFSNSSKSTLITKLIHGVENNAVKYIQPVANEMSVFQFKRTATGLYTYGAKSGYHDDMVCSLALAFLSLESSKQITDWKLW